MDGKYSQKPAKTTASLRSPAVPTAKVPKAERNRSKAPKPGEVLLSLTRERHQPARPSRHRRRGGRSAAARPAGARHTRAAPHLGSSRRGGEARSAAAVSSRLRQAGVGTSRRVKPSLCPRPPSLAAPLPARLETASERDAGTGAPARPPAPCERRGRGEPRGRDSGSLS